MVKPRGRHVPAVLCPAVTSPAPFVGGGLGGAGCNGALIDDLHAGTAVSSAPPAAAGSKRSHPSVQTGRWSDMMIQGMTSSHMETPE